VKRPRNKLNRTILSEACGLEQLPRLPARCSVQSRRPKQPWDRPAATAMSSEKHFRNRPVSAAAERAQLSPTEGVSANDMSSMAVQHEALSAVPRGAGREALVAVGSYQELTDAD